ncbi:MAG: HAD family phosphatase [Actinomycetaceae bacterium]|nr:HAD family phosphatase [Actinomycetaceae bacterium]
MAKAQHGAPAQHLATDRPAAAAIAARGIIFDFDGVLVDSEPLHRISESAVVERHCGRPIEPEVFEVTTGRSATDVFGLYIERYGIEADVDSLVREGHEHFLGLVDTRLELMPGAKELLEWLAGTNLRWAIASSGSQDYIWRALGKFGLLDMFDGLVSSADMVPRGKPAPDVFIHAAGRLGLATRECVVVEDSDNGIRAATAAGMKTIRFLADGETDDAADATVARLAEVAGLLP